MKFVRVLLGRKGDHGLFIEQKTLIYFTKRTLFRKLMVTLEKFITFREKWTLNN
jgi:hypothetical protein